MKRHFLAMCLTLSAALGFAGCGILTAPPPTATPLPTATATASPTTAPTATRPKPTATPSNALPSALAFALNKTQGVRAVEYDFSTSIVSVQDTEATELPGLALKGQDSTLNRHVVVSGITSDTNEFITYEALVLGEKVYIKGLTGVPGIDPALWYQLPVEMQNAVRRLPTARGLVNSFQAQALGAAKFQNVGAEIVDDENCTVWAAQNTEAILDVIGVTDSATLASQLGEIDGAELKIWTCADGYIHKLHGLVRGHNAQNKNDTVNIKLDLTLNRFDHAFEIQAPPDAKLFAPQEPTRTTPTAAARATATGEIQSTPAPKPSQTPTP